MVQRANAIMIEIKTEYSVRDVCDFVSRFLPFLREDKHVLEVLARVGLSVITDINAIFEIRLEVI